VLDFSRSGRHKKKLMATKEKNPHAMALGKMGGSKGGKNRAAKLTAEERSASARKAALARWAKVRKATDR
jgi:hypothetical protein